ncbi:MAG: PqqD family protein [Alphaproteobacteria bacterium]
MSRIGLLAINDEGFVFDPATGDAYTCNAVGLVVLRGLKEGKAPGAIAHDLAERFDVEVATAEHDVFDYLDHLRVLRLTDPT